MAERIQTEVRLVANVSRRGPSSSPPGITEQAVRIATELIRARLNCGRPESSYPDFVREVNSAGNASR